MRNSEHLDLATKIGDELIYVVEQMAPSALVKTVAAAVVVVVVAADAVVAVADVVAVQD